MKILANDGISAAGKLKLENAGFSVSTETIAQEGLAQAINEKGIDILLVRSATKVRKDLLDACPGLKMVGRGGVGMDNIDVDYAKGKGIEIINTPASSSQSVAELVMAHLFNMARFVHDSNRQMPISGATEFNKLKNKYAKGIELRGKTIGILGFGRIGQSVAKYALGCGMKVIVSDKYNQDTYIDIEIYGAGKISVKVDKVSVDQLLAQSDFISLHVPAQDNEEAVIGSDEFSKMKNGTRLVNAARGGVVNEDALLAAIESGKIAYAALDVFENEPNPRQDLLMHERISVTPHIGAATIEAQDRIGEELADIIIRKYGKN
jgi:D-3-phosphoglycerate dehydrogenase / 2-oxoglutarate reductase